MLTVTASSGMGRKLECWMQSRTDYETLLGGEPPAPWVDMIMDVRVKHSGDPGGGNPRDTDVRNITGDIPIGDNLDTFTGLYQQLPVSSLRFIWMITGSYTFGIVGETDAPPEQVKVT